jgi:Fe-S cluster biogenesis protein NfuA
MGEKTFKQMPGQVEEDNKHKVPHPLPEVLQEVLLPHLMMDGGRLKFYFSNRAKDER